MERLHPGRRMTVDLIVTTNATVRSQALGVKGPDAYLAVKLRDVGLVVIFDMASKAL